MTKVTSPIKIFSFLFESALSLLRSDLDLNKIAIHSTTIDQIRSLRDDVTLTSSQINKIDVKSAKTERSSSRLGTP